MAFVPNTQWSSASPKPEMMFEGPTKNATISMEKYTTQRIGIKLRFQILATSIILAAASPFALPMLFLNLHHFDGSISASFDTIISAAYLMTIGTLATLVHAKSVLSAHGEHIQTVPNGSGYIFSGKSSLKGSYLSGVSKASTYMNGGCVATFGAGVCALLFQFYPTGTATFGLIAVATILVDSIASQVKEGTLIKGNALSAVSNLRGAVTENKLGTLVPAL